jgi:hypothetical protein
MACVTITGAMKVTTATAMEMLLNLTPLDLLIMVEGIVAIYRLQILIQPADNTAAGIPYICRNVDDPILDMRSDNTTPVYNYSKICHLRRRLLEKQKPSVP